MWRQEQAKILSLSLKQRLITSGSRFWQMMSSVWDIRGISKLSLIQLFYTSFVLGEEGIRDQRRDSKRIFKLPRIQLPNTISCIIGSSLIPSISLDQRLAWKALNWSERTLGTLIRGSSLTPPALFFVLTMISRSESFNLSGGNWT